MSTSPGSLASVVDIRDVGKWEFLPDHRPLAMLHAAFWGKGITEDQGYVERRSTSNPREIGDDTDESKGDGADEIEDGDADEMVEDDDVDKIEDDEESEDDGKTGYVLEIDNDAIYMDKIFVRVSVFTSGEKALSSRPR
jgi:hypothetical protein